MHKNIIAISFLMLFALISFDSTAQKLQTKSIKHKQFTLDETGQLVLSAQINKEFNIFNKLALQEDFIAEKSKELQLTRQERYSYDPKGRHQNTLEYNGTGILQFETKLYWDEYNNKNKVEHIKYDNGKQASVNVTYLLQYDENGNKQNEQFFDADGTQIKGRTWFYNSEKEVIKSVTWEEDKKTPRKEFTTTYKRNKNGDLTQSTTIESVNGKEFKKDIHYFSNNYVIEWETYIDGKLENHFINEYRDSVIIRTTRQNQRKILTLEEAAKEKEKIEKRKASGSSSKSNPTDADIFVTNTEYDAYGNILVTSQSMNDKVIFVTQYAYDDYGNCTKTTKVDKVTNEKEEELLEYDDWGSITKRTIKKNGKLSLEDQYTYEYFPKD